MLSISSLPEKGSGTSQFRQDKIHTPDRPVKSRRNGKPLF